MGSYIPGVGTWLPATYNWLRKNMPNMEDVARTSELVPGLPGMPDPSNVGMAIDAASQVARPIGRVAGAIGNLQSEAATEGFGVDAEGNPITPTLEQEVARNKRIPSVSSASSEGAAMAPESLRKNITVLDALGIGSGIGAAATGSRALGALDLGSSVLDASLGAGDTAEGISEGDLAKTAMGVARVAGNAYGGTKALRDLGIKISDSPKLDITQVNHGMNPDHKGIDDIRHYHLNGTDATGDKFHWYRSDKLGRDSMRQQTQDIEAIASNPERTESFSQMATFARRVDAALANEEVGNLSKTVDELTERGPEIGMRIEDKTAPTAGDLYKRIGSFLGFTFDSTVSGKTFAATNYRKGRLGPGENGYMVNPQNIAEQANFSLDRLLTGQFEPEEFANITHSLPASVNEYISSVKAGGPRSPEMDMKVGSELFADQMLYTIIHENYGHTPLDSMHTAPQTDLSSRTKLTGNTVPPYQTTAIDTKGIVPGVVGRHDLPKPLMTGEQLDAFSALNNDIFRIMRDPERLVEIKALLGSDYMKTQFQNWYRDSLPTYMGNLKTGREMKVLKRSDRVVGRAEAKAATQELAQASSNQPPTPPGQVPPGASAPQGPNLPPLAQRIKAALTEHQRAVNQNKMKMAEVNALRAEMLRQNEEKLAGQLIDHNEFTRESKKIMSGDYDLIGKVDPLTVQGGDAPDFMQKIAAQSNDDAFRRQRGQIAFDKMMKGERLEDNEIGLMREILKDRTEAAASDPAYKKIGNFFAHATGGVRALMTSFDLSAAGRQALYGSVMNPGATKEAFKAQIQSLKMTKPEFESFMLRLQDPAFNPYAEIAKAANLHFSESGTKQAEEAFINSDWVKQIPGVRQSEQAYIAYLNKLRVELFNKHIRVMEQAGEPLFDAVDGVSQKVKDLSYMVNTLTGRGELSLFHMSPNSKLGKKLQLDQEWTPWKGNLDKAHGAMTSVFFAPRFAASRAALMRDTLQAMVGGGLDPAISKVYMKNVFGTISTMTAVVGGLAAMGVGTFQPDPRKKDFGVLKVGKTRYDVYGGLKPWAKIASLVGTDKYYSGQSGIPKKYGDGPMNKTKKGEAARFVQGKLSPIAGFLLEAWSGEDFMGKKSQLLKNAYQHTFPMIVQTIVDSINEDEAEQLPFAVPAAVLGVGVNTYSDRRFNKRDR